MGAGTAMTSRPEQPEPFIRGAAYPAAGDVPYPRANPTDTARLPADVWHAATVPVGVRIELVGDAQAIDVAYRTTSGNLGYRGDGAGITFSVWRGGRKVCEEEAVLGDGLVRLVSRDAAAPDKPAIIYLPEGMQPLVQSLTAVKGEIAPAPALPRWIAYGDWITQGWIASGPGPGLGGHRRPQGRPRPRQPGLRRCRAGRDRLRRAHRRSDGRSHLHRLRRELLDPHTPQRGHGGRRVPGLPRRGPEGHPNTPIVVISPVAPPRRRGRAQPARRHAGRHPECHRIGDPRPHRRRRPRPVAGGRRRNHRRRHLADGIHPGDEGHKRIAAAVAKSLNAAMSSATEGGVEAPATEADKTRTDPQRHGPERVRPTQDAHCPGSPCHPMGDDADGSESSALVDRPASSDVPGAVR